jgi:8-oxo-dGTP pyrophosphatase MutT (NUDIX family)
MELPKNSWLMAVSERLASPPPQRLAASDSRPASVLVPLYVDAGELWTVLTKRTEDLPSHRGQIAFPGGGREPKEDPWAAALRESHEEIGLDPKLVLRLGELDELAATVSGFRVVPCVGAVPYPLRLEPNEGEIAEIFSLPLSAFVHPSLIEDRTVKINGQKRPIRIYHVANRQIWGLTARILQNLLVRLGLEPPALEQEE